MKNKRRKKNKKVLLNQIKICAFGSMFILSVMFCAIFTCMYLEKNYLGIKKYEVSDFREKDSEPPKVRTVTITTAGDCTLGADTNFGYYGQFDWYYYNVAYENYGYFFEKVKHLFEDDDFSYVNLEGTLTDYKTKTPPKEFNFRGDPKYVNILLEGDIEGVNLANNHSNDYGYVGYNDTMSTLDEAGVDYFGHEKVLIKEFQGKKFAFVGYTGVGLWIDSNDEMARTIRRLKEEEKVDVVIANFHWGLEYNHSMTSVQRNRAHLAIDSGADIVIGSHPHCLQGLEEYKGKYIVYSLGNFVFGGNSHPKKIGRECIIVKMSFEFTDRNLLSIKMKIIPCNISSISSRNNYQPVEVFGSERDYMINLMNQYSINYRYVEEEK